MPTDGESIAQFAVASARVVSELTVTGLLFWLVGMLMTRRLVTKAELEEANQRTVDQKTETVYWREEFQKERRTSRESVDTLREAIESRESITSLRQTVEGLARTQGRGRAT